jgi:hypothetical protein
VIVSLLLLTSRGNAARDQPASQRITTASLSEFHARMVAKLRRGDLSWQRVVCVRNGRHFMGVSIVRCNVDFRDPHIEAYCLVLRGGRMLSNFEDPAIPCGHDNAGKQYTIVAYP